MSKRSRGYEEISKNQEKIIRIVGTLAAVGFALERRIRRRGRDRAYRDYGNYLNEVWTLDDRRGGITVAQLNDGTGAQRHFYHCNAAYHVCGLTDEAANLIEAYDAL